MEFSRSFSIGSAHERNECAYRSAVEGLSVPHWREGTSGSIAPMVVEGTERSRRGQMTTAQRMSECLGVNKDCCY